LHAVGIGVRGLRQVRGGLPRRRHQARAAVIGRRLPVIRPTNLIDSVMGMTDPITYLTESNGYRVDSATRPAGYSEVATVNQ
jgi:hypothetical protein